MKRAFCVCIVVLFLITGAACATDRTNRNESSELDQSIVSTIELSDEVNKAKFEEELIKELENMDDDDIVNIRIDLQGLEGVEDERGLVWYTEATEAFKSEHIPAERNTFYVGKLLETITCEAAKSEIEYYSTIDTVKYIGVHEIVEAVID